MTTPTRFLNRDEAARRFHPSFVDRFRAGLSDTDTVGDEIVQMFTELPAGAGMRAFKAWLNGERSIPEGLRRLLEPLEEVPPWVDWDRIDRGCVSLWRGGAWTGLAFNCASLAAGYRSGAAVKPLSLTGRLITMAYRRTQETARWMLATTSPGGLRRQAPGYKETLRVRVIHASVRRHLLDSGRWNSADWGAPINATDSAYGIAGEFSTIPVAAMRAAGLHYTQAERDDIQHLWRYVGHLLGVPDPLLATDEAEALRIIQLKDLTDTPADEDSRELVRALIEHGTPPELIMPDFAARFLGAAVPRALYGLTRWWAGDQVADELGIPNTAWKYLVPAARPAVRLMEIARRTGLRDEQQVAAHTLSRFQGVLDQSGAPVDLISADEARGVAVAA